MAIKTNSEVQQALNDFMQKSYKKKCTLNEVHPSNPLAVNKANARIAEAAKAREFQARRTACIDFVVLNQSGIYRNSLQGASSATYQLMALTPRSLASKFDIPLSQVHAILESVHTCSSWMR
ncbi:hypothetical protein [Shewanella gaetbuli]